jgi:PAS domain S-box-containing protein
MAEPQSAKILYVSPAYERVWGRSSEELYKNPQRWVESILPEDAEAVRKNWEEQVKGNSTYEEFRIQRPDGTIRWIANRAYPVLGADGRVAQVTGVATNISARREARKTFNALADKWQATFDAVQNSVCILDKDWTIIQANRATARLLNRPLEQIMGHKCYELIHGTLEPIEKCPIRGLGKEDHRATEEIQLDNRWFEVAVDPMVNATGELEGFVHIISDINERKKAEEALRKNESTLHSIFKAAPTGIGMVCDRILTQVNERLCEMVGYSDEELINQSARILYPTDADYEYVGNEKYTQISARGTGTVETRWLHKNGEILDVLLSSTPLNLNDWSEGVTFTALDITERKKTERALRASHEMFLAVLDGIDATIYVADMNTYEILFMNKFMKKSFGQDFTGQICWKVFRNADKPCEHCTNDKLLDEQGKPTGVYVWQDRNPITKKWYINYDRAIEWVDGRLVRIQIATDITEIKRLEARLLQSQKLEAIGNLAGGIAHDFNNILSAVIGYAELSLEDAEPGTALHKSLKEILRAGFRAKDLVKHILTFARRADEELKPVKVGNIAREVLKLLRSTLPVSIDMQTEIQSDSMTMADPTQIHQIFMNLCTNAAHAMESTGGILKVTLSDIDSTSKDHNASLDLLPGPYLKLVIEDTGVGIAPENLTSIFEPYFTTKPKG